jgi:pimeloyl-ACP methyl ester carboxylesterase
VYALDLPGFGFSERANRVYTPQLYTEAIIDLIERQIGEPADVIALSLGSEFAARAALQRPDLIRSLALISPSGFTLKGDKPASQSASESPAKDAAYAVLAFPLWSQGFYDVLVTRKSIYSFLRQSFYGEVDVGLAEYDYLTAHQPGARYAPLFFVSGQLFSPDIYETVYRHLTQPVLVLHDQDAYVSFERLPELMQERPNWQAIRVAPTRGLPHFEQLAATTDALDGFWERVRV